MATNEHARVLLGREIFLVAFHGLFSLRHEAARCRGFVDKMFTGLRGL